MPISELRISQAGACWPVVQGLGPTSWTIWWPPARLTLNHAPTAATARAIDRQSLQNDLPRPPQELSELQAAWQAPTG